MPWATHHFKPDVAPRGNGARADVIGAFNQARTVEELLEKHGYKQRGKRWTSPTSESDLAGVVIFDDGRAYSHHASDPLADGHSHDAFDIFRILDHGGDAKAAVKAAAEGLGITPTASASAQGRHEHGPGPANATAGGAEAVFRCLVDVQAKPIRWLWPGRIARGEDTMLAGNPGLGKSQVTASMAAIVSIGGSWPVDRTPCERGAVIILSAEDNAERTLRPRLEAAGADLQRCYILDAIRESRKDGALATRTFNLATDIDRLGDLAKKLVDVALIVIDPITAYLGGVDSHKNAEVRGLLAPLAAYGLRARRDSSLRIAFDQGRRDRGHDAGHGLAWVRGGGTSGLPCGQG